MNKEVAGICTLKIFKYYRARQIYEILLVLKVQVLCVNFATRLDWKGYPGSELTFPQKM